ncbi:MAG TPA: MoaD/ThiS family protein [Fimbriimonadaceae bacterium]|nr:MoaD/ThiS family protein [Fimbriimonadaceae bacterium]HRJ96449.1 MoaD/ThiS family protein [Fimbriimonadaceae bacterium]
MSPSSRRVTVLWFAVLRERRGLRSELLETAATTPAELYAELSARHSLGLEQRLVRVAIDGAFSTMEARLMDGVEVAFIPPVAGG